MLNIENLAKLSAKLRSLPEDYKHFDMQYFASDTIEYERLTLDEICEIDTAKCGTVACALGHGCSAGVEPLPQNIGMFGNIRWYDYSKQFIDREIKTGWYEDSASMFVFSEKWSYQDAAHHYDAADRIDYLIKNGAPPAGFYLNQLGSYKKATYK